MVNLRRIANRATSRINPNLSVDWRAYSGSTVAADGSRTPSYGAPVAIVAQVQALSKKDFEHLAALNISDCTRSVYADVQFQPVDRVSQKGGDLLEFEGAVWLVRAALEGWTTAGWSRVAVSKQMDPVSKPKGPVT